ncbi:DUF3189 family protein [Bacillus manliponensis]|uniref:ABC transporter n=2 Tax=Bacilli TaxID=91061 RepID=A0A073JSH1_9BACI|nr:DUF3189 family protein [Bacillus manliponensis]KEK18014.1 ABC transporter [Bacillus manliponensis]
MIYIYNDFGGTHTTSLAAAYHFNQLPTNRTLTKEEILAVPYFNQLTTADMGNLIFRGIDEDGNHVYTVGCGASKNARKVMQNLIALLQNQHHFHEKVVFSNTSPTVPFAMTIGGLFSRRLKIDFIGVPLLVLGAKQCCNNIMRLVQHTKEKGKSTDAQLVILENEEFK